jgi:type VI secretion system protein ImpH
VAATQRKVGAGVSDGSSNSSAFSLALDDFFHQVRVIERKALSEVPDSDRRLFSALGEDGIPQNEAIRFKGNHSLAFTGSSTDTGKECENDESQLLDKHYELVVNFMGLAGSSGVMPQHYTRMIQRRVKQHDTALADFFDLFNHRIISLFYRSWVKYRFPIQFETYLHKREKDPFTKVIQSLAGQQTSQSYDAPLYFAGHFQRANKCAANLELMLTDLLQIPATVESFIGQWLLIQDRDRAVLCSFDDKRKQRLGAGILTGRRYWDIQSKVLIRFGPISYAAHKELLPGGRYYRGLHRLINSYVPVHLTVDLVFTIDDNGREKRTLNGSMKLGLNAWLQSRHNRQVDGRFRLNRNELL